MKARLPLLAVAALIIAGGLWLAGPARRPGASPRPGQVTGHPSTNGFATSSTASRMTNPPAQLAPPDPTRRFTDFTPEQRVEFARQGHGPGG